MIPIETMMPVTPARVSVRPTHSPKQAEDRDQDRAEDGEADDRDQAQRPIHEKEHDGHQGESRAGRRRSPPGASRRPSVPETLRTAETSK